MAENPDEHQSIPTGPPFTHYLPSYDDLSTHQVPPYGQNSSMVQGSPMVFPNYDPDSLINSAAVPFEYLANDTQLRNMLHESQPQYRVYETQSWDAPTSAQPIRSLPVVHDAANPSIMPQYGQRMVEEYALPIDTRQQAGINAVNSLSAYNEEYPTSLPADIFPEQPDPQGTRLYTERCFSTPPMSSPNEMSPYSFDPQDIRLSSRHRYGQRPTSYQTEYPLQQLRSQGVDTHDWYPEPRTLSPAEYSQPLRFRSTHPYYNHSQPRMSPSHRKRTTPAMTPTTRLPSKKLQVQSGPNSYKGLVYVHRGESGNPEEVECTYWLAEDYPIRVPEKIRLRDPKLTQETISRIPPTIYYSEFQDSLCDGCRTRGICLHFNFLLGSRRTPDGLICDRCKAAANEVSFKVNRVCPIHNKRNLSQFLSSLPEDILATKEQETRTMEFVRRAFECDWEDVPIKEDTPVAGDLEHTLDNASNPVQDPNVDVAHVDEIAEEDHEDHEKYKKHRIEHIDTQPTKRLKASVEDENNSGSDTEFEVTGTPDTGEDE